jgi:hypothetical protein
MYWVAKTSRPFYFHTADSSLEYIFDAVGNQSGRRPIAVPEFAPENETLRNIWYEVLSTNSQGQGCGHIRLMMDPNNFEAYGFESPAETRVNTWLIKSFFKYFWSTPTDSMQRRKTDFSVLLGPLKGRALAIIDNEGPGCMNQTIAIKPNHAGSTQFIYHGRAVQTFREEVLAPFFTRRVDSSLNTSAMFEEIMAIQNTQLNASLYLLSPLNALPVYSVSVKTFD